MFTKCDNGTIAFVLGHELGHIIEQSKRPSNNKNYQINSKAVEIFCDICGKSLAENAGYNTDGFVKMLEETKNKRDQDDTNSDHPAAGTRLEILSKIPAQNRDKDNNVPEKLKTIMSRQQSSQNHINIHHQHKTQHNR